MSSGDIKGLIFGPRMSAVDKARAVLCCYLMREAAASTGDSLTNFAFFQATQVVDRFGFEIRPVGTLGGFYFNDHLPLKRLCDLAEPEAAEILNLARIIGRDARESLTSDQERSDQAANSRDCSRALEPTLRTSELQQ